MTVEEVKAEIEAAIPGATATIVLNGSPSAQHSLLLDSEHAFEICGFLRDHPQLKLDFCSNVSGVDWPDYLEAVYHLYSIEKKHGPIIVRMRTKDRAEQVHLPSLTPIWRSAEFQEREIFDLYGILFDGHPDLRRILMWEEFTDHPMRKDYLPPADDEDEALLVVQP
jgi:NADH-quinone oxidoreductase subunit C